MSISNLTSREYEPIPRSYSIEPMRERDLIGVVEIEESQRIEPMGLRRLQARAVHQ